MEFTHERRWDQDYNYKHTQEEEKEDTKNQYTFINTSSSSSTTPTPVEKEHMFDKVVTPSDVGKLNRLVIPKQHAEKYFPLDTSTHEKGLILNFEDRTGKPWRFRYSYWNSSQSYVMTKGWSRFVKEKRLDAGDTVSFIRGVEEKDRFFIDWKRRPEMISVNIPQRIIPMHISQVNYPMVSFGPSQNYMYNAVGAGTGAGESKYYYFRSALAPQRASVQLGVGGSGGGASIVLESVPLVQNPAAAKRVRLFGVNLDEVAEFSSSSSPSPKGKEGEELSLDLEM